MAKKKLHRSGSVARKIQDYFLSKPYELMIHPTAPCEWCWFAIPNNKEFCVALEWQNGYEGDEWDRNEYGIFGQKSGHDFYVINVSIKMTDEFRINGEYAYYAEYYYNENEDDELMGAQSLCASDIEDNFYSVSKDLADEFNRYNRMNRRRD